MNFRVVALAALLGFSALPAASAEQLTANERWELERTRFIVGPDAIQVPNPMVGKPALSGGGLQAAFQYAIASRWAMGGGIRQAFTTSADAMFTEFDLRLTLSVTGALTLHRRSISLDGQNAYEYQERSQGGLRAQLVAAQYLFNTSVQVIPYSGVGGSAYYEFPSRSAWNFLAGARADIVSNGKQSLSPLEIFGGVAFWF